MPTVHKSDENYKFCLVNDTENDVNGFWVDYESEKISYFTIKPGKKINQNTFSGHRWLLTDHVDADLYLFEAGSGIFKETYVTYNISSLLKDKGIKKTTNLI